MERHGLLRAVGTEHLCMSLTHEGQWTDLPAGPAVVATAQGGERETAVTADNSVVVRFPHNDVVLGWKSMLVFDDCVQLLGKNGTPIYIYIRIFKYIHI